MEKSTKSVVTDFSIKWEIQMKRQDGLQITYQGQTVIHKTQVENVLVLAGDVFLREPHRKPSKH